MEGHSVEQRVQIIKFYYQNQCSVREMFCVLRDFYPRHNRPAESTVRRLVVKFESTSSINNQPTPVRRRNARSAENIAAVRESIRENPRRSISCLVHKNLTFLRLQLGKFYVGTWICTPIKFN